MRNTRMARHPFLALLLGMFLLLPTAVHGDYRYQNLTMNDGLAANAVRNIVQDKYGYMWLGTDNGLCRYDGVRVLTYHIPELGRNQYVTALLAADDGIYVGTERGVFLLNFEDGKFEKQAMPIRSTVTSIAKDKDDRLWVSTSGQGVFCGEKHYDFKSSGGSISQVFIDSNNQVWTVTINGEPTVQKLNRLHDRFEPVALDFPTNYNSLRMLQTHDGRMWLGSWEHGLLLMHDDGRLEQMLDPLETKVGIHIHTLYERSGDCICIGCDDGLICLNPKTKEWYRFSDRLQISHNQLTDRFVYSIVGDTEGGLWTGTFYGGVNYLSPLGKRFDGYTVGDGLTGNVISRFCEDGRGRVWVASDDGGLMCFSPSDQSFIHYPQREKLRWRNIHALAIKGDDLWIGTYTDGVYVLNTSNGSLRQYLKSDDATGLDDNSSYAILHDSRGRTWVATMAGINLHNPTNNHFERIGKTGAITIDIDEDKDGNLWFCTQGEGLFHLDCKTRKLKKYQYNAKDAHSLCDNQVNCAYLDDGGKLWIGTFGGLCTYDRAHDNFTRIHLDVPNQNIQSIVESHGALWLSTDHGVVKYVPEESVQHFTLHDGLVGDQFQPNSVLKASDGRIYFGATNGFNAFHPHLIEINSTPPPVHITSLRIMNREERPEDGTPLCFPEKQALNLGYGDARMITISFASLSYCSPEKNQYAYMLDGFDHQWNYVGNQSQATYTNLPAGTYTFRVKATNNDGIWSEHEAKLRIVVHPPLWWSWWAKLLYLLLAVGIVWYYVHLRLKREKQRHQLEMQRLNDKKEQEVRDARLKFFTMIAHEIRTPVSLIIGPLEKIMKRGNVSDDMKVIDRNSHRLLELVNQLLDFRKIEQQSLLMHFAPQNIHQLIEDVVVRFAPTIEQSGKRFTVDYPDPRFNAIVDREALTKVMSNLLTNANKYTKDEVSLRCMEEPSGTQFRIVVSDNGIGIPEKDLQHIFDPFFQAEGNKPGTGIGLNIVKNIVDQHHGTIDVDSEMGKGSTFTVILPVKQDISEPLADTSGNQQPSSAETSHQPALSTSESSKTEAMASVHESTLLIIDDSEDMIDFLQSHFRQKYDVVAAQDGIEALDILSKREVGIIISDWMMPRMDGAELCRRVRRNPQTSHIPFVLLTAKTDDESKVEGMDVGADIYIEKPFSIEYLEACIRNMLQMRRHLMKKFSSQPLEPVTEIAHNPTDNEFLVKMNKIIEENFSNSELNVNFLADKMNISRSGLFAKIKTLADITPNEMIMIVRLKRSAQLLLEGSHTVSEVSYMVGFSSPSYFSKCFQKQFGIRPADYMKKANQQP